MTHVEAARALAAMLTEASETQARDFPAYLASHLGSPLRNVTRAVDRRLGEVAAALGVHQLDVVALHAHWVGRVLAQHPGAVATAAGFGQDFAEGYVARVMAERAGILEAK